MTVQPPQKTVAVVGSGMAGLVSAYLLRNDKKHRFEVEVFETVLSSHSNYNFFPYGSSSEY